MTKYPAFFTFDPLADAYYFAPTSRAAPPYLTQREVRAIIDIAEDGTLAGVELVLGDLPPPPRARKKLGRAMKHFLPGGLCDPAKARL